MLDLIIFILTAWGITNIICNALITEPLRTSFVHAVCLLAARLGKDAEKAKSVAAKFIKCPMCVAFWVGLLCSFFLEVPVEANLFPLGHLFSGFLASGTTWIIHVVLARLGALEL